MRKLLLFFFALSLGCGPGSIESLCDDAATSQCDRCFDCASDSSASGAELCRLRDLSEDDDRQECIDRLSDRCESQSSTLEEPKEAIEECVLAVEADTCEALVSRFAQDRSPTVPRCTYFF